LLVVVAVDLVEVAAQGLAVTELLPEHPVAVVLLNLL
jgi:hypothetical protein